MVYALYLLGGDEKRIHTEDVAVKCFELFPDSFSWVKYQDYPDKDIVRVALTDARKDQYGAHVEGRAGQKRGLTAVTQRQPVSDGWMLTERGISWIREHRPALEKIVGTDQVKSHRQNILRQLKRITGSTLFSQYLDNPVGFAASIGAIADLLRCRVDAEFEIWNDRFDRVQRQAQSAEQMEVVGFVEKCRAAYLAQR